MYLLKDHIDSVDMITDSSGNQMSRLSFDAWGRRRNGGAWNGNPAASAWTTITDTTRHGFTLHEMLDNLTLTHMNGRVYDQVAGRFLSADPFIDGPGNTQGWNRYSYLKDNPLAGTDPTGFLQFARTQAINHSVAPNPTPNVIIATVVTTNTRISGNLASVRTGGGLAVRGGGGSVGGGGGGGSRGSGGAAEPTKSKQPDAQEPVTCWNGSLGMGGALHGPVVEPVGVGASGQTSVGFSYAGDLLDSRFFVQFQGSVMVGTGIYAGVGISGQVGQGAVPTGINSTESLHSELNIGAGVGGSVVVDVFPNDDLAVGGYHGRLTGGRLGAALGVAAGTGYGFASIIGSPTIREMLQALSILPEGEAPQPDCGD